MKQILFGLILTATMAVAQEPQLAGGGRGVFTCNGWDGTTNYTLICSNGFPHAITNSAGVFTVPDVCPKGDFVIIRWCVAPPLVTISAQLRTYLKDVPTPSGYSHAESGVSATCFGMSGPIGWTMVNGGKSLTREFYVLNNITFPLGATPPWCYQTGAPLPIPE